VSWEILQEFVVAVDSVECACKFGGFWVKQRLWVSGGGGGGKWASRSCMGCANVGHSH